MCGVTCCCLILVDFMKNAMTMMFTLSVLTFSAVLHAECDVTAKTITGGDAAE